MGCLFIFSLSLLFLSLSVMRSTGGLSEGGGGGGVTNIFPMWFAFPSGGLPFPIGVRQSLFCFVRIIFINIPEWGLRETPDSRLHHCLFCKKKYMVYYFTDHRQNLAKIKQV